MPADPPAADAAPANSAPATTAPSPAAPPPPTQRASTAGQPTPRINTDPVTGERSLSLPLPDPETLQRLAGQLLAVLARLQRTG